LKRTKEQRQIDKGLLGKRFSAPLSAAGEEGNEHSEVGVSLYARDTPSNKKGSPFTGEPFSIKSFK
jgi:hypothetical protein